jgi:Ca2+-binding EF-hand superfamily protein
MSTIVEEKNNWYVDATRVKVTIPKGYKKAALEVKMTPTNKVLLYDKTDSVIGHDLTKDVVQFIKLDRNSSKSTITYNISTTDRSIEKIFYICGDEPSDSRNDVSISFKLYDLNHLEEISEQTIRCTRKLYVTCCKVVNIFKEKHTTVYADKLLYGVNNKYSGPNNAAKLAELEYEVIPLNEYNASNRDGGRFYIANKNYVINFYWNRSASIFQLKRDLSTDNSNIMFDGHTRYKPTPSFKLNGDLLLLQDVSGEIDEVINSSELKYSKLVLYTCKGQKHYIENGAIKRSDVIYSGKKNPLVNKYDVSADENYYYTHYSVGIAGIVGKNAFTNVEKLFIEYVVAEKSIENLCEAMNKLDPKNEQFNFNHFPEN